MILKAVDIREFDFTGYGTYYNMTGDRERVYRTLGEEFEDYMTRTPLIDTPGHLGYTVGMGAPYVLKAMENMTIPRRRCSAPLIRSSFAWQKPGGMSRPWQKMCGPLS